MKITTVLKTALVAAMLSIGEVTFGLPPPPPPPPPVQLVICPECHGHRFVGRTIFGSNIVCRHCDGRGSVPVAVVPPSPPPPPPPHHMDKHHDKHHDHDRWDDDDWDDHDHGRRGAVNHKPSPKKVAPKPAPKKAPAKIAPKPAAKKAPPPPKKR